MKFNSASHCFDACPFSTLFRILFTPVVMLAILIHSSLIHAQSSPQFSAPSQLPIEVTADHLEYVRPNKSNDHRNTTLILTGKVRITQGASFMEASKVEVIESPLATQPGYRSYLAIGQPNLPVRFEHTPTSEQPNTLPVRGKAITITYQPTTQEYQLEGSAELIQGKDLIHAQRIRYNANTGLYTAESPPSPQGIEKALSSSPLPMASTPSRVRILLYPPSSPR